MKFLFTLILIFTCALTYAQVIPIEQPQKTVTPTTPKKKPTTNIAKAIIKIVPDANCTIYVDGELKGTVAAGDILKISLAKGSYIIKAKGTNPNDVIAQDISVQTVGVETIYRISLNDVINSRLQKEEAIKQQAQAETEKEQRQQQAAREDQFRQQQTDELSRTTGIQLVFVQSGSFDMGSNDNQDYAAKPVHRVTVSSFYMGKYDVTQAQWRAIMGNNPSNFQNCDDCPVEMVSWDDAQAFIAKLNQRTGKHYRLPTEAEWEYAARGGSKSNGYTYSGSNDLNSVAWYIDNSGSKTHPVGQKQANELGIYDMTGNVWEWCQDWFGDYGKGIAQNPPGPSTGSYRVIRGGGGNSAAPDCRVASRGYTTGGRGLHLGFRLVLVP